MSNGLIHKAGDAIAVFVQLASHQAATGEAVLCRQVLQPARCSLWDKHLLTDFNKIPGAQH